MKGFNMKKMMTIENITIGILLIVLVILVVNYLNEDRFSNLKQHFQDNVKPKKLNFYYADYCPYSNINSDIYKKIKSLKDQLGEQRVEMICCAASKGKTECECVKGPEQTCENGEPTTPPNVIKCEKIYGYPTVMIEDTDGKEIEYLGGLSIDEVKTALGL